MFGPAPFILTATEGAVNLVLWIVSFWRFAAFIVFLLLGGFGLAWGAEPKDVQKAIAIVETKGAESSDAVEGLNGKFVPVSIREYAPPECNGGMSVERATVGPGTVVTGVAVAATVERLMGATETYFVSDANADGIVENAQLDDRLSIPAAQAILDRMVECIANQK